MSYRDEDDPFEEDIVFDQAGLLSTSRKASKSAIRRVSSGKCAVFSKTLGLCGAFLGLGLTCAIPGPLSPVPPAELRDDISLMSYEVMYRCQGFMIGAMFGARLLDRFNRLFLVFLALLVTALLVTIIPWCGIVWLLRTDMFLLGASLGFLSTGGNVLCLDLWGRNSGPFMQALHFSFSLGIFLAPFLSQPLMVPLNNSVGSPTTTLSPAMFPLHRLPRDTQNMSAAAIAKVEVPLINLPSPPSFHQGPLSTVNKDYQSVSKLTSTSPSSISSKTVHQDYKSISKSTSPSPVSISTKPSKPVEHELSTVPTISKVPMSAMLNVTAIPMLVNNTSPTVANATLSILVNSSSVATMLPSSPVSLGVSAPSARKVSFSLPNVGKVTASTSTIPSPTLGDSLQGKDALKFDLLSTTTHRAPRPKPVLTNSEKLKDKNWENDKFRKPPPEDLVPLSTTMKSMVHISNVSAGNNGSISKSTSPTSLPGNTPTSTVKNIVNVSKSVDFSQKLGELSKSSVSIQKSNSSVHATASSPIVGTVVSVPEPSSTVSHITAVTMNVNNHTSQPGASAIIIPKMKAGSVEKSSSIVLERHGDIASSTLKEKSKNEQQSTGLSKKPETIKSNPSKYSSTVSSHEDENNHTSVELTLPLLEDPNLYNDSHNVVKDVGWQGGISLDEQELSMLNVSRASSTVSTKILSELPSTESSHILAKSVFTETSTKPRQPESVNHSTQDPPLQLSTPHHDVYSKHQEQLKPDFVAQKIIGKSHGEKTEGTLSSLSVQGLQNTQSLSVNHSVSQVSDIESLSVKVAPLPNINSSQEAKNSYIGPHLGPKHTHHSKPASTVVNDTEVTHTVIDAFANRLEKYGLSKMQLMYLTVGMVLLATSFFFLGFLCFNPRDPKSKTEEEEGNCHIARGASSRNRTTGGHSVSQPSRWLRHALLGLMILLLMVTSGIQAMYGQLLMVYAMQSPLQLSQSTGLALTSTFLGALTSTRFACILLASALSPTAMLVLSVAICSCATWLLSALATSSEVALWIGSVMVGVGTASVIPSGLLWMQRHVLITHRVASMLVMGPIMGEMFFPTLAYKMMVSMGPASLVHLPALLSLFTIALWAAEWRLARYPRQSLFAPGEEPSGYQLANQHDEDDLLDLTMSPIINGTNLTSRSSVRMYAGGHGLHRMSA